MTRIGRIFADLILIKSYKNPKGTNGTFAPALLRNLRETKNILVDRTRITRIGRIFADFIFVKRYKNLKGTNGTLAPAKIF